MKYSIKYKLKGELTWYLDLVEKIENYLTVDFPVVYYALDGAGDITYKLNTIESLKVVFNKSIFLGSLSIPVISFKYLNKILK